MLFVIPSYPLEARLADGPMPIQYPHNNDLLFNNTSAHKFVTAHDGHLYFEDGVRARFWGVNLVSDMCFLTGDQVDSLVEVLRAAGANMIRLHLMDEHHAISLINYTAGNTSQLNSEMLSRLDYLIYRSGQNGIYVYLDLLDGREFLDSDGVVNASLLGPEAKVVSIFDDHLIELQKQYATNLLTHVNQYTNLTLADDPTIAVVELTNENGMFWDLLGDVKGWAGIPEPYYNELKSKWNNWLLQEYVNRSNLDKTWTDSGGTHGLQPDEDPTTGTVRLPDVVEAWKLTAGSRDYDNVTVGHARANDGSRFAYYLLKNYYTTMKQHLRALGVRVPIGASDDQWQVHPPTQRAIKECLDFSAAGYYHDHPSFHETPLMTIKNTPELFEDTESILPILSAQKIAGVPMIVREWNDVFPNDYRCESMIQMATFAAQQDWDGVLIHHFADDFNSLTEGAQKTLWWSTLHDPARWPQFSVAARIFLGQLVTPINTVIDIGYSYTDTFYAAHFDDPWFYRVAPYLGRVQNKYFDDTYNGTADIVIGSMRTNGAIYPSSGGVKTVIVAPYYWYCDLYNKELNQTKTAKLLHPELSFQDGSTSGLGQFVGFAYDNKNITWSHYYGISISSVPSGAKPFGNSSDELWCAGLVDASSIIMVMWDHQTTSTTLFEDWDYKPQTGGTHNVFEVSRHDSLAARILLDGIHYWNMTDLTHSFWNQRTWHDGSGVWARDETAGIFTLDTDQVAAVVGFAQGNTTVGDVAFLSTSHHFAASLITLDGRPLTTSTHMVLTAVGDAWNTDQQLSLNYNYGAKTAYYSMQGWDSVGQAPVIYENIFVRAYFGREINASIILRGIYGEAEYEFNKTADSLYLATDSSYSPNVVALDIYVDPSPPQVMSVEPAPALALAREDQPVSVSVNLTGPDIETVAVWWSVDNSSYRSVTLSYEGYGRFCGQLPGGEYGTTTEYYFVVRDVFGQEIILRNGTDDYTISWFDTVMPLITDVYYSPRDPVFGSDVLLTCKATDEHSNIDRVWVTYLDGASNITSDMERFSDNTFGVNITNNASVSDLEVVIRASDSAGNVVSHTITIHYNTSTGTTTPTTNIPTSLLDDFETLIIAGAIGGVVLLVIVIILRRRRS
ncbi:MAG: hypothetical protein K9W43_12535 [Candidatus Thorarchaeota archaeon]|nr:hypothetical protein [Candidatus Thorarchaeota archaeon]